MPKIIEFEKIVKAIENVKGFKLRNGDQYLVVYSDKFGLLGCVEKCTLNLV